MRLAEHCPAKINLSLCVTGRRADGYHLLESLVCFADIGDTLWLEKSNTTKLHLQGPNAEALQKIPHNLVLQAQQALEIATKQTLTATFTLEKNLPLGAGIGGGSANAAAALRGLCRLHNLQLPSPALLSIAASIGADVPVCLAAQTAVMQGVGEQLTLLSLPAPLAAVLVHPSVFVATQAVFAALSKDNALSPPSVLPPQGDRQAFHTWLTTTARNDLTVPACTLFPVIQQALYALQQQDNCWVARMSGSGSTCFGVFGTPAQAAQAASTLAAQHPEWWIKAVILG